MVTACASKGANDVATSCTRAWHLTFLTSRTRSVAVLTCPGLVLPPIDPYPDCMRITTWAEYGVICALNLAKRTDLGPVNGREIARQERLPADYVEQILLRLRRAGVITSTRGARGGYVLAKPASEISIRDVIH